jgi:cell division protein FtsW
VLRLGAPALLFLVLLAVALVQVDDYSPLILLTVWGGAMALAYALAGRRYWLAAACLAAFLAAVAGVALLRAAGPGEFARWNFYADRFMVWLDPGAHPHTGQQLLLGAQAIAGGGWFGADHAFGLAALGQDAGAVLRIPAVQDDFAPSFFLNRHGLAAPWSCGCCRRCSWPGCCKRRCAAGSRQAGRATSAWPGWGASAASCCAAARPSCAATSCSRGAPTSRSFRSWASR